MQSLRYPPIQMSSPSSWFIVTIDMVGVCAKAKVSRGFGEYRDMTRFDVWRRRRVAVGLRAVDLKVVAVPTHIPACGGGVGSSDRP